MAVQKYVAREIPWVMNNTGHRGYGVFLDGGIDLPIVDCGNGPAAELNARVIAEALCDHQPVPEFYRAFATPMPQVLADGTEFAVDPDASITFGYLGDDEGRPLRWQSGWIDTRPEMDDADKP